MKTLEQAIEALAVAMEVFYGMNFSPKTDREVEATVRRFALEIQSMGWEVDDLQVACRRIVHKCDDYPSAKQFGEALQWAIDRRRQQEVSKFVLCMDTDGTTMMADPRRVLNGVLLPSGSTHGNGLGLTVGAKVLPVDDNPKAIVPAELRVKVRRVSEVIISEDDIRRRDEMIGDLRRDKNEG